MIFDWHDEKHRRTLRERGFCFDFAALVFEGRVLSQIGEVEGVVMVVIYTEREDARWIISARKARQRERALWLA